MNEDDPLEEGSKANKIVMNLRKLKGMPLEMPKLNDYVKIWEKDEGKDEE